MINQDFINENKIYVVLPSPMMKWMELFVSDSLMHPEMVELIPSKNLNPESHYYYQFDKYYKEFKTNTEDEWDQNEFRTLLRNDCVKMSEEQANSKIMNFNP